MAGKKGMSHREYSLEFKRRILDQISKGELTIRGFARESGINRCTLQQWRRQVEDNAWTHAKNKGRPRKRVLNKAQEMALRIKELEREVELYRSFLQVAGRM